MSQGWRRRSLFVLALLVPLAYAEPPAAPEAESGRYPLSAITARKHLAVTANPYATQAALSMLRAGGSAIDAAIAAQAVLGLVEPQSSGFGGGAFLVYHDGQATQAYDGRETAPAAATATRFLHANQEPRDFHDVLRSGQAIGVPGALAMLAEAHRRHGRLPWARLFRPAIRLAEHGFPVSHRLHTLIAADPLLRERAAAHTYFYTADGQALPVGHRLRNPAYARSLRQIARDGAHSFYRGALARELTTELARAGSDITPADLAGYRPRVTAALCAPYRIYRACTAPPPSGGWTVLQTLALLAPLPPVQSPDDAEARHRLLLAERLSFADRQRYSADPAFIPVPLTGLLADTYLGQRRVLITDHDPGTVDAGIPPGLTPPWGPDGQLLEHGTSQLTIVDGRGHWLSLTTSVEDAFGSRVLIAGMLMNNQLTDFSFRPVQDGHPLANRLDPGKRPRSAMSPVLVFDAHGKPLLALGSPGGSRIIGYVVQALVMSLDAGLTPAQVVALPHTLNRNGATEIEANLPTAMQNALTAKGHELRANELTSGLALIRRVGSKLEGAADPRREGMAAGE